MPNLPCDCFVDCPVPSINYATDPAGLRFTADLYFLGTQVPGGVILSTIYVDVTPGQTAAQVQSAFGAAINTQAAAIGLASPTTIYGVQLAKLK